MLTPSLPSGRLLTALNGLPACPSNPSAFEGPSGGCHRVNMCYMSAHLPSDSADLSPSLPIERQITRVEAAAMLGLSVARVRQLYDHGRLTKYYNKLGHLRLDKDEIEALRKERETFHPPIVKVSV